MEAHGNEIIWAIGGVIMGLGLFYAGFRDLKSKRIIQNIPTSKINTGAIGTNVEVKGRIIAEKDKLAVAPISNIPCALYSIEIQELRKRKNSSHWVTIDRYFSGPGFYLDDNSGANALVYVKGAQITRKGDVKKYRVRSNNFETMPSLLRASLAENRKKLRRFRLKDTSWLFAKEYRFLEWCFRPGEQLYVLGYAESGLRAPKKRKVKFASFLKAKKMIQANPELQAKHDRNKDGVLDDNELEQAAKHLAMKLESQYSPEKVETLAAKTKMIFKKRDSHPFHISDMQEAELIKKLSLKSTLKIWGGPALTIASSVYLLHSFSIFDRFFAK